MKGIQETSNKLYNASPNNPISVYYKDGAVNTNEGILIKTFYERPPFKEYYDIITEWAVNAKPVFRYVLPDDYDESLFY